jgi:hypothetical protein
MLGDHHDLVMKRRSALDSFECHCQATANAGFVKGTKARRMPMIISGA